MSAKAAKHRAAGDSDCRITRATTGWTGVVKLPGVAEVSLLLHQARTGLHATKGFTLHCSSGAFAAPEL